MTFDVYQAAARKFAIYPDMGENLSYPTLGLSLSEIVATNIQKLQKRKDEGKIKGSGDNR